MSRPLAATLVATNVMNFPDLKPFNLTSRCDCCMSPWRALAPGNNPASSEADSFFSANIIVRPPLKQTTCQHINNI
ncbi:hypothetical protein MtrunA17_Chr6g0475261 [Medicago truncatula]|uniref:Uncharacterized protein n=1 Tax=Medicago truncatula TaxID=3880 RepID=A0A396HHA6_MEDTR|nr:hypothetical protein MtrunA17_Chr6g0475261 [Medicago truncatula]